MKRINILLITILILHHLSFAEKVNIETVKKIAVKVFIENYSGSDKDEIFIEKAIPFITENDTLFYVLNFKQNGFVIISADNAAPPVLGYCYKNRFEQADLPPGLEYLLSRYKGEIFSLRKEKVEPTKEIKNKWERLLDDKASGLKSAKGSVNPLILSTWAQGWSYNMYCPVDNGSHVPAGCVAVAMAQVLYYWQCRVEGTGQHSYQSDYGTLSADFENANYQWHAMSATSSNQYNALLIYHCGVSVDMDYGPDESGAYTADAEPALQNYFGFQSKANYIDRTWHPFNWKNILKSNLNRELPIIYRGQDKHLWPTYAHAWVIEGYDTNDKFYCNWGWSGFANGYFSLGDFSPAGYDFNKNEKALVEIEPVRSTGVETPVLSPKTFTYNPNGYSITISEAEGATSYQWTCNHGTIQGSGTSATLYSDCNSTVSVRAYNSQCQIYSGYDSETMTINYGPVTGPDLVCFSNSIFTLTNYPSGSTVNWTKSSNLQYVSGQGSGNYTVKAYSSTTSGAGYVKATVTNSGCDPIITQISFWVGNPDSDDLDILNPYNYPDNTLCGGEQNQLIAGYNGSQTIQDYDWDYSGWSHFEVGATDNISFVTVPYSFIYKDIKLRAANQCGETGWITERFYPNQSCGYFFSYSPNPSDDYVEIRPDESKLAENAIDYYEVRIYNNLNVAVFQTGKTKESLLRINTRQFQNGVYFIHFIAGKKIDVKQLVVSH